jgi:hypothetical protein
MVSTIIGEVILPISETLPATSVCLNVNDSTWTLENNDTWTSKLTQGEYTVTVSLSDNDNSITHDFIIITNTPPNN